MSVQYRNIMNIVQKQTNKLQIKYLANVSFTSQQRVNNM